MRTIHLKDIPCNTKQLLKKYNILEFNEGNLHCFIINAVKFSLIEFYA